MNADSLIEKTRRHVETELAETRHRFMEEHLDRFFRDWNRDA